MSTSGAFLRSAMPVKAAQEVTNLTDKTSCRPSTASCIQRSRYLTSETTPICQNWGQLCLVMSLPPSRSGLADGKKVPGNSGKDKVHRPDRYSFSKHILMTTCILIESWHHHLSKASPIVRIAQAEFDHRKYWMRVRSWPLYHTYNTQWLLYGNLIRIPVTTRFLCLHCLLCWCAVPSWGGVL